MEWIIPGTVIKSQRENGDQVENMVSSMCLGGGVVLSQICSITGLEPYTIHNWVKRGFLSPPRQKKYTQQQLCRIITINMLKNTLPLERVCGLLEYVNGDMDSEEDDIIDDAALYFLFVKLAARAKQLDDPNAWGQAMNEALKDYQEPVVGARVRIEKALRVMLTAWVATRMRLAAEYMLEEL